jgi:patatin-related protein
MEGIAMGSTGRQLRLALSMNGGVSLAVWIGGAVCEIDALRRAKPGDGSFWGGVLGTCGYSGVQIDVLTGASAGGLNAVLLAQSIRTDRSFDTFEALWRDKADIDELLKSPNDPFEAGERRGVLRGQYFTDAVVSALGADPLEASACHHDLSVFASATLVRANPVHMRDVPGEPIRESRSDGHFHVARRGDGALDGFALPDNREFLASIGRATSSLPGLFEPVPFSYKKTLSRLVGAFTVDRLAPSDTGSVEIMDGGVVDNIPIAKAIRAIANSPANRRVRRVLLYLHPDPTIVVGVDPPTALATVKAFFGKRKETVREDIELLRAHNAAAQRRSAVAEMLTEQLARETPTVGGRSSLALIAARTDIDVAAVLRVAVDPSELPWHAPGRPRRLPLIDGTGAVSRAELERELRSKWTSWAPPAARIRRVAAVVMRFVRGVEGRAPETRRSELGDLKRSLYEIVRACDLVASAQLASMLPASSDERDAVAAVCRLVEGRAMVRRVEFDGSGLSEASMQDLAGWMPTGDGVEVDVDSELTTWLRSAAARVSAGTLPGSAGALLHRLGQAARSSIAEFDQLVDDIDRTFMGLSGEPVGSDSTIDFIRIAGDADSPAARVHRDVADPAQKIAGRQLGHLGAFVDAEWRVNDWWWGRLDAVNGLLDAILDDEAFDRIGGVRDDIRDEWCTARQQELVGMIGGSTPPVDGDVWRPLKSMAVVDRRVSARIGGRKATGTVMRALLVAWQVIGVRWPAWLRWLGSGVRSVLLAAGGLLSAGRRSTVAVGSTLGVLAGFRVDHDVGRWVLIAVAAALIGGIVAVVELAIRPVRNDRAWYVLAVAVLVAAVVLSAYRDRLIVAQVPVIEWYWVWIIPGLAAGLAAAMLFFWMHRVVAGTLTVVTALLYAAVARMAATDVGPELVHSMWTAWLVAILVIPALLAQFPNHWLGGPKRSRSALILAAEDLADAGVVEHGVQRVGDERSD